MQKRKLLKFYHNLSSTWKVRHGLAFWRRRGWPRGGEGGGRGGAGGGGPKRPASPARSDMSGPDGIDDLINKMNLQPDKIPDLDAISLMSGDTDRKSSGTDRGITLNL